MNIDSYMFVIPLIIGVITQILKLVIDFFKKRRIYRHSIFSSWWFPSVHSSISASIIVIVFIISWPDSVLFAVTLAFWFLFAYDAMNVRYEAGKHAYFINTMRHELNDVLHEKNTSTELKERLGHTPFEVIGWVIIWWLLTILLTKLYGIW